LSEKSGDLGAFHLAAFARQTDHATYLVCSYSARH
jgi:hypothetical protein